MIQINNDLLSIVEITNKMCQKATETQEEFIFETIKPWCEEIVQQKITKRELKQALLKYYGKSDKPSDSEITLTFRQGTLKYSDTDYVVYKKDWLKSHYEAEMAIMFCNNL